MPEHDLQAANIDGLKNVGREGVAELVQVPVSATRRRVAFVVPLRFLLDTFVENIDGVFPFAVPAVQPSAECDLLAQFEQTAVRFIARAVIRPGGVRQGREDEKRFAQSLTLPERLD